MNHKAVGNGVRMLLVLRFGDTEETRKGVSTLF